MSLSRSQKIFASLVAPALVLVACQANVSVQPNPSPTPTATPFPTATPMPTATPTPGWIAATIRPTTASNDAVLAEVRRLEAAGQVTGVVVLESFPVQIKLNGSAETVAKLEDLASGTQDVAITTLSQRSSNIHEAGVRNATTVDEFRTLWQQHTSSFDAPPTVDFNTQSVLAVFGGEKPTGGYTAAITSVKQLNTTLTVHYRISSPDPNTGMTQVITYPAHIVSIPLSKSKGDFDQVNFVEDK